MATEDGDGCWAVGTDGHCDHNVGLVSGVDVVAPIFDDQGLGCVRGEQCCVGNGNGEIFF